MLLSLPLIFLPFNLSPFFLFYNFFLFSKTFAVCGSRSFTQYFSPLRSCYLSIIINKFFFLYVFTFLITPLTSLSLSSPLPFLVFSFFFFLVFVFCQLLFFFFFFLPIFCLPYYTSFNLSLFPCFKLFVTFDTHFRI